MKLVFALLLVSGLAHGHGVDHDSSHGTLNGLNKPLDKEAAKACKEGCAHHVDYDEKLVKFQSAAQVGDLVRCPISGVIFKLKEKSPFVVHDGKKLYTCCASCAKKLAENPAKFF